MWNISVKFTNGRCLGFTLLRVCRCYFPSSGRWWGCAWHSRMSPCVWRSESLTELASLACTLFAEIWTFEFVDSTDIKSVFVCVVCDRFFLMILLSVPIFMQVSSNIPDYVFSFIFTLCMKVHHFSCCVWNGGPVVWTSCILYSAFVAFLCYSFCYNCFLGFVNFLCILFLLIEGIFFILLIR